MDIERQKKEITVLLRSTQRSGIENVISYLDTSGYFTAPSSKVRHHNWYGGLAQHCMGVCEIALDRHPELPKASVIIAALLHDLCKARQFSVDRKGNIYERHLHILGHGRRSVKLIYLNRLRLTHDEQQAIACHMHAPKGNNLLWRAIHEADRIDAARHQPISHQPIKL